MPPSTDAPHMPAWSVPQWRADLRPCVVCQEEEELTVIELGAGRGYLSLMLGAATAASRFVLVDNQSFRLKAERRASSWPCCTRPPGSCLNGLGGAARLPGSELAARLTSSDAAPALGAVSGLLASELSSDALKQSLGCLPCQMTLCTLCCWQRLTAWQESGLSQPLESLLPPPQAPAQGVRGSAGSGGHRGL